MLCARFYPLEPGVTGLVSDEYERRRMLSHPLPRMGWRGGGDIRGERKEGRMANKVSTTEARTIIIVWRYRWPNGSCLEGQLEARPI
jgi:hypothetical protein